MLYKLGTIDSTQKYLFKNINSLKINDAVYATFQSKGYGRTGIWESSDENIYFSIVCDKREYSWIYIICAIHMFCIDCLKPQSLGEDLFIKIPNDVYYKDKKLSGFIVEVINNKLVIGIGINVFIKNDSYSSLNSIYKQDYNIDELCNKLYLTVLKVFDFDLNFLNNYFIENTYMLNTTVTYIDLKTSHTLTGVISHINFDNIVINSISYNMYQIKILKIGK